MKNKWNLYYIDLFAGPGRCLIRDTQKEIDGSPLIALLGFNFAKYYFLEADTNCLEALTHRIKKRAPEKYDKVQIVPGDCNETINQIDPPKGSLGLAFIDPTGISPLAFDTIRKLTENRKIDLIINFHEGMGIRMNMHQYAQKEDSALDSFVGSARWRSKLGSLSFDKICKEIANEFLENLSKIGYLSFDNERIPVRTNQNALLYYLIFASKHPKGSEFWRKISLIGPSGQRKLF